MTMKTITKTPIETNHERETAKVRADLLRRAEAQAVKPFASREDFAGDPKLTAGFDVDKFLRQMRQDRDWPSRSVGSMAVRTAYFLEVIMQSVKPVRSA